MDRPVKLGTGSVSAAASGQTGGTRYCAFREGLFVHEAHDAALSVVEYLPAVAMHSTHDDPDRYAPARHTTVHAEDVAPVPT